VITVTEPLSTRIVRAGDNNKAGPLWLVVLGDQELATHPLPSEGEVTLGRSVRCEIPIDDKSISRRHAVLRLGEVITIEDLESANGTRVGGVAIEPRVPIPVRQGELIELGDASILLQRRPTGVSPRRLWSHGYFEGRLEDECARAEGGAAFSLAFLHCDARPPLEAIHGVLADVLRPIDVAGEYGAGEYEVLLVGTPAEAAEERAAALVERLGRHGVSARAGVACFPRDGRTPDELLARASGKARPGSTATPSGFVVEDPAMIQLRRVIDRVAGGMLSVLLLGETGVGKEVLAQEVHRRSPRRGRPFVGLNCAAVTETLLESELFGHEKGAFTGAIAAKPGLLETASGGTVFLDEIGEVSLAIQAKLLRVLEERKVMRVGGLKTIPIDVRFVAATNRDLEQEIARGKFREDLYYRLAGITLAIPPLRERAGEIAPLAHSFMAAVSAQSERKPQLTREALEVLEAYSWPGNIRELRNVIERAVLLSGYGTIRPEHLPMDKMRATYAAYRSPVPPAGPASASASASGAPALASGAPVPTSGAPAAAAAASPAGAGSPATAPATAPPGGGVEAPPLRSLEALYPGDAERDRIIATLERCRGNQTKAAKALGMSRRTLIYRLERYGLPRPRKPAG
jgi:two-component system, NtrC family, response regulator AtoC